MGPIYDLISINSYEILSLSANAFALLYVLGGSYQISKVKASGLYPRSNNVSNVAVLSFHPEIPDIHFHLLSNKRFFTVRYSSASNVGSKFFLYESHTLQYHSSLILITGFAVVLQHFLHSCIMRDILGLKKYVDLHAFF